MKRKTPSDQKNTRSKRHKASRKKRTRKLERTPKYVEQGERNAKENKERLKYKGEYVEKSNARRKYKDAPENRPRRGHQQREANHKGSEKEEEVSRVLAGFSLTLRPRKIQISFNNRRLILASVYN